MKQETTNKIAEIFAAQLAAANAKATPKFTGATGAKKAEEPAKPQPQPTPKPVPAQPKQIAPTPVKLKNILLHWHEGTGKFDGTAYNTWGGLQKALGEIYSDHTKDGGNGYSKTKVEIIWENGKTIIDRIDVGNSKGDFNPTAQFIGEYLKTSNSVMYKTTLMPGDRQTLSFADESGNELHNTPTPPPPAPKQPQPTPAPELSQLTFDDLMKETCSPVTFAITKAAEALQTPAKSNAAAPLIVVEYSPKSFAVFGATGEETKAVKDQLATLGGSYNPRLNYEGGKRQGWIFPNYRRQAVNAALSTLQQQAGKATA